MADSSLPQPLPPANSISRSEARDLGARIETAIGAGTVRETPRVDAALDSLRLAATAAPSQAQRDQARQSVQASPHAGQTAPHRAAQAVRPARATA